MGFKAVSAVPMLAVRPWPCSFVRPRSEGADRGVGAMSHLCSPRRSESHLNTDQTITASLQVLL